MVAVLQLPRAAMEGCGRRQPADAVCVPGVAPPSQPSESHNPTVIGEEQRFGRPLAIEPFDRVSEPVLALDVGNRQERAQPGFVDERCSLMRSGSSINKMPDTCLPGFDGTNHEANLRGGKTPGCCGAITRAES